MPRQTRRLLATDMDGTIIPLEDTPGHRKSVAEFRHVVEDRDELVLAYVTGRDRELAEDGIREWALPTPHFLVCDVGTGVYRWDGTAFQEDEAYRDLMLNAMGGVSARTLRRVLRGIPGLRLQEKSRQGPFKVSYYLDDDDAGEAEPLVRAREALARSGARVSAIYSRDVERGVGLLDLLPAGVAKDRAVAFLQDRAGVPREWLVYAGDSGNDRAAMLAGYRVVVVGNAPDSLREELREEAARLGLAERIFFAAAPYAAGVLEGLRHWGWTAG